MTVREVYWKVMREEGLSDDLIRHSIERVQIMVPQPLDRELSEEQAEEAERIMRELHEFACANPETAKATILSMSAKAAAKN